MWQARLHLVSRAWKRAKNLCNVIEIHIFVNDNDQTSS